MAKLVPRREKQQQLFVNSFFVDLSKYTSTSMNVVSLLSLLIFMSLSLLRYFVVSLVPSFCLVFLVSIFTYFVQSSCD